MKNYARMTKAELIKQIEEHTELRKLPILMLTTTDDPREVERCHALGGNAERRLTLPNL